jgi:hypothetical protein
MLSRAEGVVSPSRSGGPALSRRLDARSTQLYALVSGTGRNLSSSTFAICFLVGCAVVALWLDVRFPRLGPATVKGTLLHVAATIVAAQLLFPVAFESVTGSLVWTLAALFVVALPALTYSLLVAVWVLKLVADASRGRFH